MFSLDKSSDFRGKLNAPLHPDSPNRNCSEGQKYSKRENKTRKVKWTILFRTGSGGRSRTINQSRPNKVSNKSVCDQSRNVLGNLHLYCQAEPDLALKTISTRTQSNLEGFICLSGWDSLMTVMDRSILPSVPGLLQTLLPRISQSTAIFWVSLNVANKYLLSIHAWHIAVKDLFSIFILFPLNIKRRESLV